MPKHANTDIQSCVLSTWRHVVGSLRAFSLPGSTMLLFSLLALGKLAQVELVDLKVVGGGGVGCSNCLGGKYVCWWGIWCVWVGRNMAPGPPLSLGLCGSWASPEHLHSHRVKNSFPTLHAHTHNYTQCCLASLQKCLCASVTLCGSACPLLFFIHIQTQSLVRTLVLLNTEQIALLQLWNRWLHQHQAQNQTFPPVTNLSAVA